MSNRVWMMIVMAMVIGCGGAGSGNGGSGTGGSGGSEETTSSAGGSGGTGGDTGGATPLEVTLQLARNKACVGDDSMVYAIDGQLEDEAGTPLHEDGALIVRCFAWPSPFTVTAFDVHATEAGPACDGNTPISYVWFRAAVPSDEVPIVEMLGETPAEVPVWKDHEATTRVDIEPVPVNIDQMFCRGMRLHATAGVNTCMRVCKLPAPAADPMLLYSNTRPDGTISPCPGECDMEPLYRSPTAETGDGSMVPVTGLYGWKVQQ